MKRTFSVMKESVRQIFPILSFTEKGSEIFGELKVGYMKQTSYWKIGL